MTQDTEPRKIKIIHKRQHGTYICGTLPEDRVGKALRKYNFRGSRNLPEELGDAYWYQPHSRRRRSDRRKIAGAKEVFETLGFSVEVTIDDTTPAIGFDDLEDERAARIDGRADRYDKLAQNAEEIDRSSAGAYRERLSRLWKIGGSAWELYDRAATWHARAESARRYRHRRYAIGTTQRRIHKLEAELRKIERDMAGKRQVWVITPERPLDSRLQAYADKGIPVTVLSDRTRPNVFVHIGLSDHHKAVLAADVVEKIEEIAYWEAVVADSGVKVWTKDDFADGDFVSADGDRWYEVVRRGPRSLSVPGLYEARTGNVRTYAGLDWRSRSKPSTQNLPYTNVTARLSAAEVKERFPEAFNVPEGELPPKRPGKKQCKVRVEDGGGHNSYNWWFDLGGEHYRVTWQWPDGWWHTGEGVLQPCTDELPPVRFTKADHALGSYEPAADDLILTGPLWHYEQVYNQVVAYVNTLVDKVERQDSNES